MNAPPPTTTRTKLIIRAIAHPGKGDEVGEGGEGGEGFL